MIDTIIEKIRLNRQKKCLEDIRYVLEPDNIFVYNTGNGLIKYHRDIVFISKKSIINDPLIIIKKYYLDHYRETNEIIESSNSKEEIDYYQEIADCDIDVINELTDDFIDIFNKYNFKLNYIKRNWKYLDDDYKDIFLTKFKHEHISELTLKLVK